MSLTKQLECVDLQITNIKNQFVSRRMCILKTIEYARNNDMKKDYQTFLKDEQHNKLGLIYTSDFQDSQFYDWVEKNK